MLKSALIVTFIAVTILISLRLAQQLTTAETVEDVAILAGWVITVLVASHQLTAARAENDRARREGLRTELQVEAFRQISAAVVKFSSEISAIESTYMVTAFTLGRPSILPMRDVGQRTYEDSLRHSIELLQAMSRFAFVIETYQIALTDIHHLYLYIRFRVDDVVQNLNSLRRRLSAEPSLESERALEIVKDEAAVVGESLSTVRLFIGDFRVEVMNALVGPLFDRHVARRQPLKASIKTLVELATPSRVMEEDRQRTINAVVAGLETSNPPVPPA